METPYCIEPCLLETYPATTLDLIQELTAAAKDLSSPLHPSTAASLADLVRFMNCYYSNLIEGHHTRPKDIEHALLADFESDENRRNLQLEALAHIRVQRKIDTLYVQGALPEPASVEFITWLHREFYQDAPESMLTMTNTQSYRMQPGELRNRPEHDVSVGRHQPPASSQVAEFMRYFEQRYRFSGMRSGQRIIAMAAAHHRLAFIHPFPDGNGRVSRLMSHAMGLSAGIGASGLWSVSSGLARSPTMPGDYKQMLANADSPRLNDWDGRGNLSQKALLEFIEWFLSVCLDQVKFMSGLFEFGRLTERLKRYVEVQQLKPEAFYILQRVLLQGEMPRGEALRVTGLKERSARILLGDLTQDGILRSQSPKGPVSLHFGVDAAEQIFPKLFAET